MWGIFYMLGLSEYWLLQQQETLWLLCEILVLVITIEVTDKRLSQQGGGSSKRNDPGNIDAGVLQ